MHGVSGSEAARCFPAPFQPLGVKLMSSQAQHMCVCLTNNPTNFCGSYKIWCQKKRCNFGFPVNFFLVLLIETKPYCTIFWILQKNQLLVHDPFLVTSYNLLCVLTNLLTTDRGVKYPKIWHAGHRLLPHLRTFLQTLAMRSSTCLLCSSAPWACKRHEARNCFIRYRYPEDLRPCLVNGRR